MIRAYQRFTRSASADGVDILLSGMMAGVAVFAGGMSVDAPVDAWVFVVFTVIGCLTSLAIRSSAKLENLAKLDGWLYASACVACVFVAPNLNDSLPEPVFTGQLGLPLLLTLFLVAGSFFSWRDGTQLFQAVPAIALFGLIGAYDNYPAAVVFFFVLLLALATLFARVHLRTMAQMAQDSGFGRLDELRRSAWRWVAGPEWALASALAVALLSFIVAPYVQQSVTRIVGNVAVHIPRPPTRNRLTSGLPTGPGSSIGNGPISITATPVLLAVMDGPHYLRAQVFSQYSGHGWQNFSQSELTESDEQLRARVRETIADPTYSDFQITSLSPVANGIPTPGFVVHLDSGVAAERMPGDIFVPESGGGLSFGTVSGTSAFPRDPTAARGASEEDGNAPEDALSLGVPSSIVDLAENVTAGISDPYDKALAIKHEIGRRCTYDLEAPATPSGSDPIEYFLMNSHLGYCDLFASSMVMMARSVGIPARYVIGYYPFQDEKDQEGRYVIRQSDAHAWAELYFPKVGWIPFDATEDAASLPGEGLGGTTVHEPWYAATWVHIVLWAFGMGVGLFIIGVLIRSVRVAPSGKRPSKRRAAQAGQYERFAQAMAGATGVRRHASATPDEYVALVGPKLGSSEPEARRITDRFVAAFFGSSDSSDAELEALKAEVKGFKRGLRKRTAAAAGAGAKDGGA